MIRKLKRRSLLYVPGSSEKALQKASALKDVDSLLFDLEDSVAPDNKDTARYQVCNAIRDIAAQNGVREIVVRVNPVASPFNIDDLLAVVPLLPDSLIIPKASAKDVACMDGIITSLELKHGLPVGKIDLLPLIETAGGVMNVAEIIRASNRVSGVFLGGEDLTRDMAINRTDSGNELQWCRNFLAMACKAASVDCIDTPYSNFRDVSGFEADTSYVKSIGMTGRSLIHPSQIEVANKIFSPSPEEIEYAIKVVAAYEEALDGGRGAISLDGKMIDVPIYERAKSLLASLD